MDSSALRIASMPGPDSARSADACPNRSASAATISHSRGFCAASVRCPPSPSMAANSPSCVATSPETPRPVPGATTAFAARSSGLPAASVRKSSRASDGSAHAIAVTSFTSRQRRASHSRSIVCASRVQSRFVIRTRPAATGPAAATAIASSASCIAASSRHRSTACSKLATALASMTRTGAGETSSPTSLNRMCVPPRSTARERVIAPRRDAPGTIRAKRSRRLGARLRRASATAPCAPPAAC